MTVTHQNQLTHFDHPMLRTLADNWSTFLIKGICAILFGVATFFMPGLTLIVLTLLYGAYVLTDGILSIIAAINGSSTMPRWWLAIFGLLSVAAGLVTFFWPGITLVVLQLCIGLWAVAVGVMQIIGAIRLRNETDDEWLLVAGGIVSILFGVVMVMTPGIGMLALVYTIAAYAIFHGIIQIVFAFKIRGWKSAAKVH